MLDSMLTAIYFGHDGRDAMLREAVVVYWPMIHREIVKRAHSCPQCFAAGKNLECPKSEKGIW